MKRKSRPRGAGQVSISLPIKLRKRVAQKAKQEDLTFSQMVRRAVRRELSSKGGLRHSTQPQKGNRQ